MTITMGGTSGRAGRVVCTAFFSVHLPESLVLLFLAHNKLYFIKSYISPY